jgi:tRNA G18 (ribose-2'-O)-methylase SpoU
MLTLAGALSCGEFVGLLGQGICDREEFVRDSILESGLEMGAVGAARGHTFVPLLPLFLAGLVHGRVATPGFIAPSTCSRGIHGCIPNVHGPIRRLQWRTRQAQSSVRSLTASAHSSQSLWTGQVHIPCLGPWSDITDQVTAALPAVSSGLCHIEAHPGTSLVLIDTALFAVAPPIAVAPYRSSSLCLMLMKNRLIYPSGTRLALIRETAEELDTDLAVKVMLRLEACEEMLQSSPFSPKPAFTLAQVALRAALVTRGVNERAIRELEQADEPTPAFKVYESFLDAASTAPEKATAKKAGFVGAALRPETLMPAAQRTAHHISHLLREEAALRNSLLRNADKPEDAHTSVVHPPHRVHVVLDNLRSAYNVGSIFRTADAARCAEVVTCGFTPHPPHPKLSKTGFGAVESVPSRHVDSTLVAVATLQAQGVKVFCMETTDDARSFADVIFPPEALAHRVCAMLMKVPFFRISIGHYAKLTSRRFMWPAGDSIGAWKRRNWGRLQCDGGGRRCH